MLNSDFDNPPGTAWATFSTTNQFRPLTYESTLRKYSLDTELYSVLIREGEAVPDDGPDIESGSYNRDVTFTYEELAPGSYELLFAYTDQEATAYEGPSFTFGIAE